MSEGVPGGCEGVCYIYHPGDMEITPASLQAALRLFQERWLRYTTAGSSGPRRKQNNALLSP